MRTTEFEFAVRDLVFDDRNRLKMRPRRMASSWNV